MTSYAFAYFVENDYVKITESNFGKTALFEQCPSLKDSAIFYPVLMTLNLELFFS
jgi:hypothetical protein